MFERAAFRDFSRVLRHALFACMIFVFGGTGMAYAYTVTYDCGFYTGTAPASATAPANASFTPEPAASGCNPCDSTTTLTGWAVSGTSDVKTPGTAFTWDYDENKTFTAVWSKYPNVDNTACVTGRQITLMLTSNSPQPEYYQLKPTVLYTIPTRGAFLDAGRTLEMTTSANPIELPHREFWLYFDTNAPINPAANNTQYAVASVAPIYLNDFMYECFFVMVQSAQADPSWNDRTTCFIIHDVQGLVPGSSSPYVSGLAPNDRLGYLTDEGIYQAKNFNRNQTWFISGSAWGTSHTVTPPSLTGYTFTNWCATQVDPSNCFYSRVPSSVSDATYFAQWTPKTYNVVYNKGAHATSGSADYTDTNGATYDSPYTPLSFYTAPISNSMSADTGYVFVGWTADSTPTFTNGSLDNEYTGDTWWKRTSGLTLYAAYDCDSANGYYWNENHTACVNTYTLTYVENAPSVTTVSGMPTPNPVTSLTAGATPTLASGPTVPGYIFDQWDCKDENQNTVTVNSNQTSGVLTITMPSSNVTCTAQWTPNMVGLVWNDNDATTAHGGNPSNSCQYGPGSINIPTQPAKTGYSFNGWLVTNWACSLANVDPYLTTYMDATRSRWKPINGSSGYTMQQYYGTENSNDLNNGDWSITFSYGTVSGISKCSSTSSGTLGTTGTPSDAVGASCWCQTTKYVSPDGNQCNISSPVWVFTDTCNSLASICTDYCAYYCVYNTLNNLNIRRAILGQ